MDGFPTLAGLLGCRAAMLVMTRQFGYMTFGRLVSKNMSLGICHNNKAEFGVDNKQASKLEGLFRASKQAK